MPEEHPVFFNHLKQDLDESLSFHFETMAGDGVPLKNYIGKYKRAIKLYMDIGHAEQLAANVKDKTDPDIEVLQGALSRSKIATSMFSTLGQKVTYLMFLRQIDEGLKDLEHQDWGADEVTSWMTVMQQEVKKLQAAGYGSEPKNRSPAEKTYLGRKCKIYLCDLDDE